MLMTCGCVWMCLYTCLGASASVHGMYLGNRSEYQLHHIQCPLDSATYRSHSTPQIHKRHHCPPAQPSPQHQCILQRYTYCQHQLEEEVSDCFPNWAALLSRPQALGCMLCPPPPIAAPAVNQLVNVLWACHSTTPATHWTLQPASTTLPPNPWNPLSFSHPTILHCVSGPLETQAPHALIGGRAPASGQQRPPKAQAPYAPTGGRDG